MTRKASHIDKGRLYSKVVYIYFCFYAMAVAERFSVSVFFGAAVFISVSALARMIDFLAQTRYDSRLKKFIEWASVVFFMLSVVCVLAVYPFLYLTAHAAIAIVIITLPLLEHGVQSMLLRRKQIKSPRAGRAAVLLGPQAALVVLTGMLVWVSGLQAFEFIIAAALGMVFSFLRQWVFYAEESEDQKQRIPDDDVRLIRSARLYDGMAISSGVALHIFAFTYVLYILLSIRLVFFHSFFIVFAAIAIVFGAMSLATQRFLRASLFARIGKNAAFVLGTAIAIFAAYMLRGNWFLGGIAVSVQAVLLLVGLTLQMTATLGLREDILLVIKLHRKDVNETVLRQRSQRLEHWTALISEAIMLCVLILLIFDPAVSGAWLDDNITYASQISSSVVAVPTVFLLLALVYSVKQPLTQKYTRRLKAYVCIKEAGKDNPEMENRLRSILIKKYKKRIGVHIIRAFLRPVMYHSLTGEQNVQKLPAIFVFNHREVYGPIAAVVFLPYDLRPWILSKMLDKNQIIRHMYEGTFIRIKWMPVFMRKLAAAIASPIVAWALNSLDPIPVYRGTVRNVIKTFELSIECLQAGDSILLFPENPEERYTQHDQVSAFYRGFANLGRLYYKRAHECVTFYPVFASRFARVLRIGEGVTYDPLGGRKEEGRIVETLEARMRMLFKQDEQ